MNIMDWHTFGKHGASVKAFKFIDVAKDKQTKIPKTSTDFCDWDNKTLDSEYGQNELNPNEGCK